MKYDKVVYRMKKILAHEDEYITTFKVLQTLGVEQKIIHIEKLLKQYDILSDIKSFNSKCNKKSEEFRKKGNTFFASKTKRDLFLAISFYNAGK